VRADGRALSPPGRISVASQSGNILSAFLNYAVLTGVGVSKAISTGNSAQTGWPTPDVLRGRSETAVGLAYLEGVADGRAFIEAVRRLTAAKAARAAEGRRRAEASARREPHRLARDRRARLLRPLPADGVLRAPSVEHAFEWAASFATQPLPRGRRVIVLTTAGGWVCWRPTPASPRTSS